MGMFDEVRCDYPLSPAAKGNLYQTKDIQGDIGGLNNLYYINPSGYLYFIDYYGTSEWVRDPTKPKPQPYVRLQTGKRGRVKHMVRYNGYFTIIASYFKGRCIDCPEFRLDIKEGQVKSFKKVIHQPYARRNHSVQFYPH